MASPLVSVEELASMVGTPDLVIADCRWYLDDPEGGRTAYLAGHIPGAVFVSLDDDLTAPEGPGRHPLPRPEAFATTMGALGVGEATTVVAYDDSGGAIAARLWWMLDNQGFEGARVLDGGIDAWRRAGHPLSITIPEPHQVAFRARPWHRVVDIDTVAAREEGRLVIDARAAERYRGDEEPIDPKAGHIPGAISLPLTGNLAADDRFLPPSALRERYVSVGVTDAETVIAQCGSGVTACHDILAMRVAGLGTADLYEGSWSDWSSTDLPIATGPTP